MKSMRWAVLISGTGSNLQTLLDRAHDPMPLKVYSSKANVPGLSKARRMGIPVEILPKPIDWGALHQDLSENRIQKIFLLGFMRLLPENFVKLWENKIVNLHPSLLPLYPGLNSFEKAWEEKSKLGVSVHFVNEALDAGQVIRQKSFPRSRDQEWDRLRLSWTEQHLVREIFDYEFL
jgi:folate-dependent phosphoribosylglycinamide formyltransferase PurN